MSSPPEHTDRELTLALERSEARYRFLTETIPVQVWTARPDGNLDYVSEQTASALGLTAAELLAEGWQNVVHPDDLGGAVERWVHSLGTGETYEVEFRLKLASGEHAWHLARAVPQRESTGAIVGWIGTNTNIEEQRAQQRKMKALLDVAADNAATLATTLSSIGDGVIATDPHGRITFVNPVAEKLTGWSNVEAVGKVLDEVFRIVAEGSREPVESPVTQVLREGVVVQLANHTVLLRRDGAELSIEDSAAPIRDAAGTLSGVVLVFRDASEKRRIEEERRSLLAQSVRATKDAEAARAELEELFMQAPAPICIFRGAEHVFTLANPAYTELFGSGRTLVGLPVREALPELEGQAFYELLDGVYRTGQRFVGENLPIKLQQQGQTIDRFLTFVYDAFRDIDGQVAGVLVMAFDVTDNVRARESAQTALATTEAARREAEAASRAKDEFLATASHELRTPLSAILGWARLLRGETLDASSFVRGLEVIERNAQVQVQLIEDMLDGSRIISGRLHLEIRSLDFAMVVQAAVDAVRPAAVARNIGIEVALGADERLRGDPDRLQQVVWNLLNNAIKFTPKGGHVHVELGRSGTHIELVVRDSGQGIAGDFLPHVFDRFRQADGTSTRRHGGLGLGLALVRHLVEAHGGNVRAESEGPGKGATFTVLLPVLAVYPDAAIEGPRMTPVGGPSPNAPRGSLAGLTILVVDDENDVRDLVATLLEMHGAAVKTAASVEQAMSVLEEMTPSILISDIGMPEADGYSLLRRVRALEGLPGRVPAIALTAYAREEDRRRAAEAGFQTHVAKPVDPATLVRLVAETVSAARAV